MMTILSRTSSLRGLLALAVFAASIAAAPVNAPAQSAAPFDPTTFCDRYISSTPGPFGPLRCKVNLTGPIPPEIGNLTNLRSLELEHNRLTGPIPPGIGNLTNLPDLDLSFNRLTGPIPPEIGNLTNLTGLDLSRNQLTGIPPEIGNLTNLTGNLDLSLNQLTGPIPPEIGNLTNLRKLDLSFNRLTGPIPPEIMGAVGREGWTFLDLRLNRLTGTIPKLGSAVFKYLHVNLSCNKLTGPIPEKLRKIWDGTVLNNDYNPRLRGNMLTGGHYILLKPTCFFDDIEGSVHETNIDLIAGWRITIGCDWRNHSRFCPSKTVNRAQMATFLYRAASYLYGDRSAGHLNGVPGLLYGAPAPGEVRLSDVADDASYRPYARWAVANGVIRAPGGNFKPDGAVTRADMAEMLVAAFAHLTAPDRAEGLFTDTAGLTAGAVRAVEGIAAAEVSTGCATSPRRYCPDKTVTRAQMASFLARAVQSSGLSPRLGW